MKYYQEPYQLSTSDDEKLRARIAEIRQYFHLSTSYKVAFIAPYGIAKGKNSSLVSSQVKMEDLFKE